MKLSKSEAGAVLLYRAGFLGDVLMATAALPIIPEDLTVVFATWKQQHPLLSLNPYVDHILMPGQYRVRDFEHTVDLRHEEWPDFNSGKMYWGQIMAKQIAETVPGCNGLNECRPEIYLDAEVCRKIDRASQKPLAFVNNWSANGVGWRLWSQDKWIELVGILNGLGYAVVQIGGPNDPPITGAYQAPGMSLEQSLAMMTRGCLVIGIDSFIMHVASSKIYLVDQEETTLLRDGIPGVLLSGPIAPGCVVPSGSPVKAVIGRCPNGKACGESHGDEMCKHENACMTSIEVEEVIECIKTL